METTLETLHAESAAMDALKADYTAALSALQFTNDGDLAVEHRGEVLAFSPDDYALGQVSERLKVPVEYIRRCPAHLRAANLNHWLAHPPIDRGRGQTLGALVRTSGDTARAILSQSYRPIDNTTVLDVVREMVGSNPYKLYRSGVGRDGLHLRVAFLENQGPEGGNYALGVYIHNGETGNRSLMVAPFILRHSCFNSVVWTEEAWKVAHVHRSTAFLRAGLKEHLGRALKFSDQMVEQVVAAEEDKIPDLVDVIGQIAKKHGLSDVEKSLALAGTENQMTRMGLVNGLSYVAQRIEPGGDPDRVHWFEKLAGTYLSAPEKATVKVPVGTGAGRPEPEPEPRRYGQGSFSVN